MADAVTDVYAADEQQLADMKAWFFKENIRINEEKAAIEQEKEQMAKENERMAKEKELFEKKLEILKKELYRLAVEKKAMEQERIRLEHMKKQLNSEKESAAYAIKGQSTMFFRGVGSEHDLKKRYKDLLKIYHPDNMCGDTDTVQRINQEFSSLKRKYDR